ncbi:hypothetical protein [Actinomadura madurae]|uniref:hypothetical protein n=1 Tax=Actinomadura madurae TaxID=1993 RepID=UPI0020D1F81D|nr:hypothetical protein [Actinomadura madurae]MCP9977385.1 hypothetical protein [Actinomadura madurae]
MGAGHSTAPHRARGRGRPPGRLEEVAIPVLTEREPLTAGKITAIRLAALCLACEVDGARTADPFRGIVTGITLMERAAVGQGHGGPP